MISAMKNTAMATRFTDLITWLCQTAVLKGSPTQLITTAISPSSSMRVRPDIRILRNRPIRRLIRRLIPAIRLRIPDIRQRRHPLPTPRRLIRVIRRPNHLTRVPIQQATRPPQVPIEDLPTVWLRMAHLIRKNRRPIILSRLARPDRTSETLPCPIRVESTNCRPTSFLHRRRLFRRRHRKRQPHQRRPLRIVDFITTRCPSTSSSLRCIRHLVTGLYSLIPPIMMITTNWHLHITIRRQRAKRARFRHFTIRWLLRQLKFTIQTVP